MLRFGPYPLYSLDASAFIDLWSFRRDVFPAMWRLVEDIVNDRRLLICEEAADECKDTGPEEFIRTHREHMVVTMADTWRYLARLQIEASDRGAHLVKHGETRNEADPFVVALALLLEERDLNDLGQTTRPEAKCAVVSHERRKGPGATWIKIPNACDHYGLECIDWQEFLMREGYRG